MKTNSSESMRTPRITARIMSAIIVSFCLLVFVRDYGTNFHGGMQLILLSIGLLGLILAWKKELSGGIISFLSILLLFFINTTTLDLLMFVLLANALLFIDIGYRSRESGENLVH